MLQLATLSDLPLILCGHAHNPATGTGCTAIIAPHGALCGVDVRGGGPATRETDALKPENSIERIHGVVLSGGSAFGLAASSGVMEELTQRNIGFLVESACVPIVTGACLFDLLVGENDYPDQSMGKKAARNAFSRNASAPLEEGNVGAGCGASVGKLLGKEYAMKSGFGIYGLRHNDLVVVALVAVNAIGNITDKQGQWIAGCLDGEGRIVDPVEGFASLWDKSTTSHNGELNQSSLCTNTTIGAVLTNAKLTKAQATKTSSTTHDAYARAIKPVHTSLDGDTIFTLSTGEVEANHDLTTMLATECMQQAIERAVLTAQSAYGLTSAQDVNR